LLASPFFYLDVRNRTHTKDNGAALRYISEKKSNKYAGRLHYFVLANVSFASTETNKIGESHEQSKQ